MLTIITICDSSYFSVYFDSTPKRRNKNMIYFIYSSGNCRNTPCRVYNRTYHLADLYMFRIGHYGLSPAFSSFLYNVVLSGVVCDRVIPPKLKGLIYKSIIRAVLSYGIKLTSTISAYSGASRHTTRSALLCMPLEVDLPDVQGSAGWVS